MKRISFGEMYAEPSRNGLTKPKRVRGEGTKLVNMGEIFAFDRLNAAPTDRAPLTKKESETFLLKAGDLLFARQSLVLTGAGKCSVFLGDPEPVTFESHLIRVRLDTNQADPLFYFYYFKSPRGRDAIESIVEQGAGAAGIRGTDLATLQVDCPPRSVQKRIANVLSELDDKIELNRRMNETLDAMARAIFKDWFVDFGPTRAKAEGCAPYLASEIWDLFPDTLDDDGKPVGWQVGTLGDCFHLTMGQSPPGSTYNDDAEGLPFFQGRTDFGFRYPENRKYCSAPTRIAERDDTLVSVRAPVGDINMAWEKCCAGRGVAALRHASGARSFTYYSAWAIQQELKQYEHTGTVFGAINKKQFEALTVLEPTPEFVALFENQVAPLDERIRKNVSESRTLSQTRDFLLPKLMSGEIRLAWAENEVLTVA